MIADIDILFKIAGLHDRMIAGLHDRKIICGKVRIFLFFEHIALRATLPCRCNLVEHNSFVPRCNLLKDHPVFFSIFCYLRKRS